MSKHTAGSSGIGAGTQRPVDANRGMMVARQDVGEISRWFYVEKYFLKGYIDFACRRTYSRQLRTDHLTRHGYYSVYYCATHHLPA
jgi:hypothetical protein